MSETFGQLSVKYTQRRARVDPGGGGTPANALQKKAPPERGAFFRFQVHKRVGISLAEVCERVGRVNRRVLGM